MSDIHALSGAYAVHGLDDLERMKFERHLRDCPSCRDEVDGLTEAASLLAETTIAAPSAELRSRILGEIATVRPLPPVLGITAATEPVRRRRLTRGLAAAAAAVVLAGTGVTVWHSTQSTHQPVAVPVTIDSVLHASDAKRYPADQATLVRSKSLKSAVLVSNGMDALPSDKTYEAWFKVGTTFVPAGLFTASDHQVLLSGDARDASEAAVTIENAGGSTTPTWPAAAEFPFEQA